MKTESNSTSSSQEHGDPSAIGCFLSGGGEMGERIRAFDWSKTPLGPMEKWSPTLKTIVRFIVANGFPQLLWWGPDFIQIYNDPYRPILGVKHPDPGLGRPVRECWSEIWHILKPLIETPFSGGPATWMEDILLEIKRHGFVEEAHFTVGYSPVPDDSAEGGIGGVLATVHEITEKVVSERRALTLRDLGTHLIQAKTAEDVCTVAAKTMAAHDKDVPFALLYLLDASDQKLRLVAAHGATMGANFAPSTIQISGAHHAWPVHKTLSTGDLIEMENLHLSFSDIPRGPWSDPPDSAVVVSIPSSRMDEAAGVLILGVSARLKFDGFYRDFFELIRRHIATAVANVRASEEEKKRAVHLEKLVQDRTAELRETIGELEAFSYSIAHDMRAPLRAVQGFAQILTDEYADKIDLTGQQYLRRMSKATNRMDRLIVDVLSYGRIVQAEFPLHAIALDELLRDILESYPQFHDDHADIRVEGTLPRVVANEAALTQALSNLIGNAIKFSDLTTRPQIRIRGEMREGRARIFVQDDGIGIARDQHEKIFEIFQRVDKNYDGTGIGLAIVKKAITRMGGQIGLESELGKGSTFWFELPLAD